MNCKRRFLFLGSALLLIVVLNSISSRYQAGLQWNTRETISTFDGWTYRTGRSGQGIYLEDGYFILSASWSVDSLGAAGAWPRLSDEAWDHPVYFGESGDRLISRVYELRQETRMDNGVDRFGLVAAWQTFSSVGTFGRGMAIPIWWFFILWSLAVLGSIRTFASSLQAKRRARLGLCPACGYDLRASPARCPECGRATGPETDKKSKHV